MARNYASLVKEAIVLLDRFSAGRQCLDDFIQNALKDLQVGGLRSARVKAQACLWLTCICCLSQNVDMLQRKFILDVVSGCAEHKKLLDVVINAFYGQHVKSVSRGERSQFVGE